MSWRAFPLRRYAPALIVATALLLVVIVAPSKGPSTSSAALAGGVASGIPTTGSTAPGYVSPTASAAAGAGKKGHNAATPGSGGTAAAGTSGASGVTPASGSTAHCVHGLQFSVPGFEAAPPCQPTFAGNNGGATFRGVTASRIEVVYYQPKSSLALNAILGPAGLAPSVAQVDDYIARATQFINSRYELWGRKLHVDDFVSQSCQASPPSDACFRQDAQTIVAKYHPFAVIFPRNITAPGFNAELSHLGVTNLGGMNMPLSFSAEQAPYHFDYDMDGDTQAELTGEWYCKELANRKATYAGEADLRGKPRSAEVLSEDTPEHVEAANRLAAIINHCDHGGGATVKTYSPDTSQAVVQSTTLASQAKQNGITTMLYFTDPVFPVYLTPQMTNQNYFPENVVVGSAYLDFDALAQLYNAQQWKNAFGLGDLPDMAPLSHYDSGAVYRSTHGSQGPFISAANIQGFFTVLAAGLQQAGPTLNPTSFESGVLTLPAVGGSRYHSLIKFGAGDLTGVSDARIIFWDPSKRSPVNGKAGTYVALDHGRRYTLGAVPSRTFTIPGRG
ncbi:MAG TPA: hypothetical protein VG650_01185 [Mycobacteriales bacterium]|nr:hypothetical protein [Mycobacteriales bacterium]